MMTLTFKPVFFESLHRIRNQLTEATPQNQRRSHSHRIHFASFHAFLDISNKATASGPCHALKCILYSAERRWLNGRTANLDLQSRSKSFNQIGFKKSTSACQMINLMIRPFAREYFYEKKTLTDWLPMGFPINLRTINIDYLYGEVKTSWGNPCEKLVC